MRKGYTLVSCLGVGNKKDNTYRKTDYKFENGEIIKSSLVSCALLSFYKEKLRKAVIIGTERSSWNELLQNNLEDDQNVELWYDIENQISNSTCGITLSSLNKLEDKLSEIYGVPFKLLRHSSELSDDNQTRIMDLYSHIYDSIESNTKLLIDVTNGFRYMPMLLFQSLQIRGAKYSSKDVTLLYGEYRNNSSIIRNISTIWKMAEINKQMYAFESSFDGILLSRELIDYDEKLADFVYEFSSMVQKNFVMQIKRAIQYCRLTLDRRIPSNNDPQFVSELAASLEKLCSKFPDNNAPLSLYLYIFSEILYKKGLVTQAIIALREALFTKLFEKYDPNQIGVYISMSDLERKDYYQSFKYDCKSIMVFWNVDALNKERNKIAHAGGEGIGRNLGDSRSEVNFEKYYEAVTIVFEKVLK